MSIKVKLAQAKNDFDYIQSAYGHVHDFTGSGMEDSQLQNMLDKPSAKTAYECYVDRINLLFTQGYDDSSDTPSVLDVEADGVLVEIAERYSLNGY